MVEVKNIVPTPEEADKELDFVKDRYDKCIVIIKTKGEKGEGTAVGQKCSTLFLAHTIYTLASENKVAYAIAKAQKGEE